jgi:hypothetical protein
MFGALLASSLDHYTPQGFWAAYRDIDGQPINLREHQDAFEFFNVLFDQVGGRETYMPTVAEKRLTSWLTGCGRLGFSCKALLH